jgi:hypothetical protein
MRRSDKSAVWTDRLRRYQQSGLSVAQFCDQEGVSTPSFYQWKKRLAQASAPRSLLGATKKARQVEAAFQQLTLVPSTAVVAIEWANGVRMELPAENVPLVRAVVAELLHADHLRSLGGAPC